MQDHNKYSSIFGGLTVASLFLNLLSSPVFAEPVTDYVSIPPLINTTTSGDKPNVLFILDNSNSMDEAPNGRAVGSTNDGSKSQIARNAIKDIINSFRTSTRMGLMAYKQTDVHIQQLHDAQYDVSYDPNNYDPSFTGDRASSTKRFRIPNPSDINNYIYYNVALPFYAPWPQGRYFCWSNTAEFDNGLEHPRWGPWDWYTCYWSKTGTSDDGTGYSGWSTRTSLFPTDSDIAQNILDFGKQQTWQYVGPTWFSNSSPGKGFLHVEIKDVDDAHKKHLENKLATQKLDHWTDTEDTPLRNAGYTPIQGTLQSALAYFNGTLASSESITNNTPGLPPTNLCEDQDYVILVTDGLPSTDANGNSISNTSAAVQAAANEAAKLLAQGIRTYVIGFALPTGIDSSLLNTIAIAGGTETTYLANDSDSLHKALESIFLSFANRDASSSSSAVLTKNSRGEGAVFQAIYSPERNDALGNTVTWVGDLFGLFMDAEGFLREDTNQNGQLDDYTTDRVAEYSFDISLGKTRVKLFYGPNPDTAPNASTATPSEIVSIDDLKFLWETRSNLGNLQDVLTQRPYSNNANTGRYIISSVDGSSTIDFSQITDDSIAQLAKKQGAAQEELQSATNDVNVLEAQLNGLELQVIENTANRDEALAERNEALAERNEAIAERNEDLKERDEAQDELEELNALYPRYVNRREVKRGERKLALAEEALAETEDALAETEDALAETEEALQTAENNLTNATEARDQTKNDLANAKLVLNDANNAYMSATAEVNSSSDLINYLDVSAIDTAYNIVKFVRGEDGIPGFRSRALDYDNDGTAEVWRLGDIVHSSPAAVASPDAAYDIRFGDKTYAAFREKYKNRRRVIYVGSNDGMLHAFNSGFWDGKNKAFRNSNAFAGGNAVAHPLGSELWAYVPRAALPHLQWLVNPNYSHSYYVDGSPIVFDANIFENDTTHPYGWGTVLAVGMRFGGGPIGIDKDANGSDDTTVRSSYILFDVTDPEQAPKLIAEISHPNLGFTTSIPAVVKKRVKGTDFQTPTSNEWYLAFGSGPTELNNASSTQKAGLYLYDLKTKAFVSGFDPLELENNSFIGDIAVFDDGDDFVDDTLYYGVSGGNPTSGSTGMLKRTMLDTSAGTSTSTVINPVEPIISAPVVTNDRYGRRWINYGTGRLFSAPDNITAQARHFYGVMEPLNSDGELTKATVLASSLEDTTDFVIKDTGELARAGGSTVQIPSGTDIPNYNKLVTAIRENRAGWVNNFNTSAPSTRNLNRATIANNVLFYTSYSPSKNICQPEGSSRLYAVDFRTGTALPFEVFAVDDDPFTHEGNIVDNYISLGQGLASESTVIQNSKGTTVSNDKSTTEKGNNDVRVGIYKTGRQSWRQIFLNN